VIPAVHPRGSNVGGLLRYLFGPGKREEHAHPHLVAAWLDAGNLADLEPATTTSRRDVRRLAQLLEQPVRIAYRRPAKTVWHCSIRTHPTDRLLSNSQWAHIAGEVMAAVGLAPHGDHRAVRWVAVRHADDHIHLVATVVRQDRRTASAWNDYRNAQRACRELEERYGLYRIAPPGAGTRSWPTPRELNKAARRSPQQYGRAVAPRELLRRQVRTVATVAVDEPDFFARLRGAGILVRLRYSNRDPGQVTGYAVGLPEHTTAAGQTVWYGGGRLAADLTLPRLRAGWTSGGDQPHPARTAAQAYRPPPVAVYQRAAQVARDAAHHLAAATTAAAAAAIADAAADLLAATASAWEGRRGGPLTDAAEAFDRAAREPRRTVSGRVAQATRTRAMARLVALMGALTGDDERMAAIQLINALAGLADNLADIRESRQRLHQAHAARTAAAQIRAYLPRPSDSAKPSGKPAARPPRWQTKTALVRLPGRKR